MPVKRILIDARPLADPRCGGVKYVTEEIIKELLASPLEAEYFFVTTGVKPFTLPDWITSHSNTHSIHLTWPNKLWSLASMFGIVTLDGEAAKKLPEEEGRTKTFDRALIPNLGFTGFINTPYALLLHDLSFIINPRWFSLKSRIWHIAVNPKEMIRRAAKRFSVSETTARDAARIYGCDQDTIGIVKPGIVQASTDQNENPTHDARRTTAPAVATAVPTYALVLGAGDPRKNVPTAIKAFEILKRDPAFTDVALIVIGTKKIPSHEPKLTNIEWKSHVQDSELNNLYNHATLFLYPSWYEGYGLPLHEAARFNIPCIASTDGALPETAPEGTLFVPPSKPHLWAKAMRDILSAPDKYKTTFNEAAEKPDYGSLIEWMRNER